MELNEELPNKMSELDQAVVDFFCKLEDFFKPPKRRLTHKRKLKLTAMEFHVSVECIQRILNDWAGITL
jgi:hypothetical protein